MRRFTAERIRGIGRATREFVARAKSGEPWYRTGVQSAGNGVAMRSAPVGNATVRDTLFNRLTETVPRLLLSGADPRTADRELYSGTYVLESLPFALFCFLRRPTEPIDAILDAVNNSRDSDTVGAICGGFAGALNGTVTLDPYWVEELEYSQELDRLGRALADAGHSSR